MATEPLPPTVPEILADASNIRARYPSHLAHQWRCSHIQPPSNFKLISRLFLQPRTASPRDTPAASFYRIYKFFVLHDNISFRNELEYFCRSHPEWPISSIPEPRTPNANNDDPSPPDEQVRYTILAVLTRLMCDSFNRRIELGLPRDAPAIVEDFEELQARPKVYDEPPEWARQVPPLPEKVFIPNGEGRGLNEDDEDVSKEFKDVNIIVQMPHIHFI